MRAMSDPKLIADEALERVRKRMAMRIDEMGISTAKLARRAKVSPRTIQRLLHEPGRDVYVRTIGALAAVLLIDVKELFEPLPPEASDE